MDTYYIDRTGKRTNKEVPHNAGDRAIMGGLLTVVLFVTFSVLAVWGFKNLFWFVVELF